MDQIINALHLHNWYAFAALLLTLLVQLFRKAPGSKKLWDKIPDGYRWAIPMISGAVTGFTQAFAAGLDFPTASLAAVGGAIGISIPAMGINSLLTEAPMRWNGGAGGAPPPPKPARMFPSDPPLPGGMVLILAIGFAFHAQGCSVFGSNGSFWPKVERCAPVPGTLVSQAADVLLAGGDYEAALKELAVKDGAAAVVCAVQAAVDSLLGKVGASPEDGQAVARGKAFMAKREAEK